MDVDTRAQLLQQAEFLIRTRGYSAFSYADLSARVAITKASVHYYFPTKEALVVVLVREYLARFRAILAGLDRQHPAPLVRLRAYAQLFLDGFEKGMLPLCGALSAELSALPAPMGPLVREFFQVQLDWLASVVAEGLAGGVFHAEVQPAQAAMVLLSTVEGGSFIGWAFERKVMVLASFDTALHGLERRPAAASKAPASRKRRRT
jgi:TetR/AcrR family transcriptional regulator, transcriptional repressor for nem operon